MARLHAAFVILALLGACSKPAEPEKQAETPVAVTAAPAPSQAHVETFGKNCTWGEVRSLGLAIWSYACGPEFGSVRLVPSATGFDVEANVDGAPGRNEAIRVFTKEPGAPVDAILPAVQAVSPGPFTAQCTLQKGQGPDGSVRERYELKPPADIQAAWDKSVEGDNPTASPCGAYGPQFVGTQTFELVEGAPDKVVLVNWGSEIQVFDASTLRPAE